MSYSTCSVAECERTLAPPSGRGMCSLHYKRWRKYGSTDLPPRTLLKDNGCTIPGCGKGHATRGLCSAHYTRLKRTGSATTRKLGEVVDGKRICATCKVDTPLAEMANSKPSYCRSCINAAGRARPKPPIVLGHKPCAHCGESFGYNTKQNMHCSPACAQATVHRRNWKHLQNRRARLKAAFIESFNASEIYDRDGWLCGICRDRIDPGLKLPNQMSASIDHIIPIAKGGTHERSNVQAAHLVCNVSKGAKMPA